MLRTISCVFFAVMMLLTVSYAKEGDRIVFAYYTTPSNESVNVSLRENLRALERESRKAKAEFIRKHKAINRSWAAFCVSEECLLFIVSSLQVL